MGDSLPSWKEWERKGDRDSTGFKRDRHALPKLCSPLLLFQSLNNSNESISDTQMLSYLFKQENPLLRGHPILFNTNFRIKVGMVHEYQNIPQLIIEMYKKCHIQIYSSD
jgi:hypothetical protein